MMGDEMAENSVLENNLQLDDTITVDRTFTRMEYVVGPEVSVSESETKSTLAGVDYEKGGKKGKGKAKVQSRGGHSNMKS